MAAPQLQSVDVAIVGGVLVLEARDRTGGKTLNRKLANGGVTEVGAEFVGPTQNKVIQYISTLGLQTFDTYNNGSSVLWNNDQRILYVLDAATGGVPPVPEEVLAEAATIVATLDGWAATVDTNAPWEHPNATEWDSVTFGQWVNGVATQGGTQFVLISFTKAVFAAEPAEVSLLYVIAYISAAGDESNKGTFGRVIGVTGGAQEKRVEGRTQLIPLRLADKVGEQHISLNTPVHCIVKTSTGYHITAKGLNVWANKVVLALAPSLVKDIKFSPPLPHARTQLNQLLVGAIRKAIANYDTPFWRTAEDLNGQAISDTGATKVTFDNTPSSSTFGAVMGFILGDNMRALNTASTATIKSKILSDFSRYFGQQAKQPREFIIQRGDLEEFSKGAPVAFAPIGVLSRYGQALREPVDGIH
ncbi:hypothetical protein SLS60_011032 [Paraconiothyrium brasiliense]|uniref:Amine oxidase n=1 Tax=Paraconiothyrium brasiliense TaxID=300254 RepID=A0ABR3QKD8_9PLEO